MNTIQAYYLQYCFILNQAYFDIFYRYDSLDARKRKEIEELMQQLVQAHEAVCLSFLFYHHSR